MNNSNRFTEITLTCLVCVAVLLQGPQSASGANTGEPLNRICSPTDLYLILGQSNATGAGTIRTIGGRHKQRFRRYLRNFNRVDYYSRTSLKKWDNAVTDFAGWGPLRTRLPGLNGFGLEMALGRTLFSRIYANEPDRRLAILKVAVGASPLMAPSTDAYDSWGDVLVDRTLEVVRTRLQELATGCVQRQIKVKGLIWVHGESDVYQHESSLPQYPARFRQVISRFSSALDSLDNAEHTVDTDGMRVIMTAINHQAYVWKSGHLKSKRDAVFEYNLGLMALTRQPSFAIPGAVYIKTRGMKMVTGNNVHYDGTGVMQLGATIANRIYLLR